MTMASEFPRGWVATNEGNGVIATVTIPASPGVQHVLDSFYARLETGGVTFSPNVLLASGAFVVQLATLIVPPAADAVDTDSDLVSMAVPPGAVLSVTFSSGGAGIVEFLRITGHDI